MISTCARFDPWMFLATLLMLSACTTSAILFPSTDPRDSDGAARQSIPFGNGHLEAWTKRSTALGPDVEPAAYVLCFTGNGSRAEAVAPQQTTVWSGEPVEIWAINYPGYGGSSGPADIHSIGPTALAAYDFLARRGKPIVVSGHSLGCVATLYVAARRPAAGVLLRSPPPLRHLIMGYFGWWNLWLLATPVAMGVPGDLDSITNARATHCPGVFLITGDDSTVPRGYQEQVQAAYAGPRQTLLLPTTGHNDPLTDDQLAIERSMLHALWSPEKPATVQSSP